MNHILHCNNVSNVPLQEPLTELTLFFNTVVVRNM